MTHDTVAERPERSDPLIHPAGDVHPAGDAFALAFATAQTQQQLAEQSLTRLAEHTRGLDALLRAGLRRAFVEELQAVHQETERAVRSLRTLQRRALTRLPLVTAACAAVGLAAGLTPAYWLIPSPREIAQRQATVAAQLSPCALPHGQARLCVRIDRAAGAFGPAGDYFVLRAAGSP